MVLLPRRFTSPLAKDFPSQVDRWLPIVQVVWRQAFGFILDDWQTWLLRSVFEVFPKGGLETPEHLSEYDCKEFTMTSTFTESVQEFVAASPWLTSSDAPAVVTLQRLADELDNGALVPALVAQFGLTFRNLLKRAPVEGGPADELEQLLGGAG